MNAALVSPIIILACAVVLALLERRFPYDRGQRVFREGFWSDFVGYAIVQSYVLGLVITSFISWIDGATGASRFHVISDWPVAAQVALFVVTHDFYIYWFHRTQ